MLLSKNGISNPTGAINSEAFESTGAISRDGNAFEDAGAISWDGSSLPATGAISRDGSSLPATGAISWDGSFDAKAKRRYQKNRPNDAPPPPLSPQ